MCTLAQKFLKKQMLFRAIILPFLIIYLTHCGQVVVAGRKDSPTFSVSISAPSSNVIHTQSASVSFTIDYEAGSSITLTSSDILLSSAEGVSCSKSVSAPTSNTRLVTISNCSGLGTLSVSIAGGTASNASSVAASALGLTQNIRVYMDLEDNAVGTSQSKDFSLGSFEGTAWSSAKLVLSNSGGCDATSFNCSELSSDWTPRWYALQNYWKLDNSYNDEISSDTLTPSSTPSFDSDAKIGTHSLFMDGASDYVSTTLSNSFTLNSDFTVSGWMKPDPTSALLGGDAYRVFRIGCSSSYAYEFWLFDNSGASSGEAYGLRCATGPGCVGVSPTGARFFNQNKYYMISFVKRGSALELYVNGSRMFTGSDFSSTPPADTCNQFSLKLAGNIDDVAIWNEGLLPSEIALIHQRQSAKFAGSYTSKVFDIGYSGILKNLEWKTTLPFGKELPDNANNENSNSYSEIVGSNGSTNSNDLMSNIMALWHFNESSITASDSLYNDFYDSSGNNKILGAFKNITLDADQPGILDKSVHIAYSNLRLNAPLLSTSDGTQAYTLSMWIRAVTHLDEPIISQDDTGTHAFAIGIYSGLFCYEKNSSPPNKCGTTLINDGSWHHLAFTRASSGSLRLYVDGVLERSSTDSNPYGNTAFQIAHNSNRVAYYDEIAVWNRALHANEIRQLYRRGANRVKIQLRACTQSDCSDNPTWSGPNDSINSSSKFSYFSEFLNNDTIGGYLAIGDVLNGSPHLNLLDFFPVNNSYRQYFQYRVLMESDESSGAYSPNLESVSLLPL